MQLDRLKQTHNLWFSRQDLSSGLVPLLNPESPQSEMVGGFRFCSQRGSKAKAIRHDVTGERSACGTGRFGAGNATVRQAKLPKEACLF